MPAAAPSAAAAPSTDFIAGVAANHHRGDGRLKFANIRRLAEEFGTKAFKALGFGVYIQEDVESLCTEMAKPFAGEDLPADVR